MVIPQFRELTKEEKARGFTSIVFVRPGPPATRGLEVVNPQTGEGSGSIDPVELSRRSEVGGRKFKGELFVTVPARAEIEAAIRRREEKKETAELAKKEAAGELARRERGLPPTTLTQKGSRVILTRLLQEKAQKELAERLKAPTREERIREIERKQRVLSTLEKQQLAAQEDARQKTALEIFSPKAIEQFGLGETAQGLLTITEGERKKVVEDGRIRADIPVSAEFTKGFEKSLGTGVFLTDEEKRALAFGTGGFVSKEGEFLTFTDITKKGNIFLGPVTTKIFRTKELEQQQKRIREDINKLEGKKDKSSIIQRRFLKGELAAISTEIGIRKQFGEQPIETALFFVGGALITKGIVGAGLIGKPITKIATGVLGTLFVGATAAEIKREAKRRDIGAGAEVLGERFAEATALITGGALASRFLVTPKKVKVLKAKGLEAKFGEILETKGTSAKNLQRLGLKTEVKTRVLRFGRKAQLRRIKTPREVSKLTPERLSSLLAPKRGRGKLKLVFGLEPTQPGKKVSFPTLFREIKPTVVKPKVEPEIFEITAEGKLVVRFKTGEAVTKDIGIKRTIDPALFKRIQAKDLTVLQRQLKFEQDVSSNFRAAFLGEAKITGKVKRVRTAADIFGIDLFPQTITTFKPVRARLGFKPILAVSTIFEPSPTFLLPTSLLDIFGKQEPKKKQKFFFDVDIESDFKQGLISLQEQIRKTRQKQKPILEQVIEGERITIQKPILDVFGEQLPIVDVISIQEQEQIIEVIPDIRREVITEQITEQETLGEITFGAFRPRKKPKEIKNGKFEGYNALVKGRKGKQLKVNTRRTLTKKSAISASARVVDNSIAATGSVKKVISKRPPVDTKDNYFQSNRNKFRTFRIRKGKRIPLKDKFIEKRGKRLDTRGEVRKITAARLIAQQRKKARQAISSVLVSKPRRRTVRFI